MEGPQIEQGSTPRAVCHVSVPCCSSKGATQHVPRQQPSTAHSASPACEETTAGRARGIAATLTQCKEQGRGVLAQDSHAKGYGQQHGGSGDNSRQSWTHLLMQGLTNRGRYAHPVCGM